jgi:hypothetical protein
MPPAYRRQPSREIGLGDLQIAHNPFATQRTHYQPIENIFDSNNRTAVVYYYWVKATNAAGSGTFGAWNTGYAQAPATPPAVDNAGGASNITVTSATLNGNLISTGGAPTSVRIYRGPSDGGTNEVVWTNVCDFGILPIGPFSTNITGLESNTTTYYRCFASNASGIAWAPSTTHFTTPAGATNHAPVWTSVPVTNAMVGQFYSYGLTAMDADVNPLAFIAPALPS